MRIIDISKSKFDEIKPNIKDWLQEHVVEDLDTIFHFLSDLTDEDRKFLHQNADNFVIEKKQIMKMVTEKKSTIWSWSDKTGNLELDDNEFEVYMKVGRKYYNKLQKYPIENMGVINIMDAKLNFITNIIKYSFFINVTTMVWLLTR